MSKLALSGLALGAAMAVGTAQAEPLTLSADQMDQVTAAGFGFVDFDFFFDKDINVDKDVHIFKQVDKFQFVDVFGYFAQADAGANCSDSGFQGCQADAQSFTDTVWNPFTSTGTATAVSLAESATSGPFFFTAAAQ